jgi:non-specific serine/threonine protein kinase/serine/threonine-protein kinase
MDDTLPELFPHEHVPEPMAGQRVGPYEVVREIGRGGMGAVYLAIRADDEYKKEVAIKVVKRGMDTEVVLRRFREERQILANLVHPSIASLLDGGTTEDGRPYLVMEYVDGLPIDRYCQTKGLRTRDRLQLFRGILAAVHHAHQNLVIHCDLKPRNILVTQAGEPKLLDFGIAKMLSPESAVSRTVTSLRQMTPEYASPEQVRGEVLSTATDIYSLGVILYELLTANRPYRLSNYGPEELVRLICREDPPRPSLGLAPDPTEMPTLRVPERAPSPDLPDMRRRRRELRGDIDNIVMRAMHKEVGRRYASAEQLSEDLRRHLEGLPVSARPDSFGYRASKFVRRHRTAVAAAAFVLLSLVGGIVATASQARIARLERAKAQRRFDEVRQLAHSFLFEFHDAIQDLSGATPARELLVKRGLQYLDRLSQEAGDNPGLVAELAAAYQKVGDLQGRPGFANLGDRNGALTSYRKALALRQSLPAAVMADDPSRRDLATNHDRIGDALLIGGDSASARQSYEQAVSIREEIAARASSDSTLKSELARGYQRVADALAAAGDLAGAIDRQQKALAIQTERGERAGADSAARRDLFIGLLKTGNRQVEAGHAPEALGQYKRALAIAKSLSEDDPSSGRAKRERAVAEDKVGDALRATGDRSGAAASYRTALGIRDSLSRADPRNAELVRDRAVSYSKLANLQVESGDIASALTSFRRSLALDEGALHADPANEQARLDVASDLQGIGDVLQRAGAHAEAALSHRRALDIWEAAAKRDPSNAEVRLDISRCYLALGRAETGLGLAAPKGSALRQSHCRAAREWLESARSSWKEVGGRRSLSGPDADAPAAVDRELRRCGP